MVLTTESTAPLMADFKLTIAVWNALFTAVFKASCPPSSNSRAELMAVTAAVTSGLPSAFTKALGMPVLMITVSWLPMSKATRWPVVCCFDSGNLEPVVAGFRKLFPAARFVLLADDDRHMRRRLRERMERVGVPGKVDPDGVAHVFHLPPADGATEGVQLRVRAWFGDHAGGKRISFSVQRGDAEARTWHLENAGRAACALVASNWQASNQ